MTKTDNGMAVLEIAMDTPVAKTVETKTVLSRETVVVSNRPVTRSIGASLDPKMPLAAARNIVLNGLNKAVKEFKDFPPEEMDVAFTDLAHGSSAGAYMVKKDGALVADVQQLRDMISQLSRLQEVKHINFPSFQGHGPDGKLCTMTRPQQHLMIFYIPAGYCGYAGEVSMSNLIEYHMKQDIANGWKEPENTDSFPPGPMLAELASKLVFGRIKKVPIFRDGVKKKTEYIPIFHSFKLNLVPARIVSFLLDDDGKMLSWQAGRHVQDMPVAQLAKRVILHQPKV